MCDGGLTTDHTHAILCAPLTPWRRREQSKGSSEMPLPAYGVLIGTLNHFTRDDPTPTGSFSHGTLYVDTPAGQYEGAVDVLTPSGIKVQYRLDPPSQSPRPHTHPGIASRAGSRSPRPAPPARWTTSAAPSLAMARLPATSASGSSARIPSLGASCAGWRVCATRGLTAPAIMRSMRWRRSCWAVCGSLSLARLLRTGLGVHDIHLNQGDPLGQFQHLDGTWQDGAVLIERPSGEIVAFLTKFETQSLHTNSQGLPI